MVMKRVAIIGGGPGGLMAAYLLEQKSPDNLDVTLFEASGRVGGKLMSRRFNTAAVLYEAGTAELYDYSQLGPDPLRQLVDKLGLPTVEMFGQTVVLGDHIMRNRADIKRHFGKKTVKAIAKFHRHARALLRPRDFYDAGWPDDNKHVWVRRSFQSVLAKVPDETARRFIKVAVHSDLATEPHLTSGLYGLENCLMDNPRYMQYYTLQGGLERLPQALRASIAAHVELNRPVVRIEKTDTWTYRVFSRHNGQIVADDFDLVMVALPYYWLPTVEWGGKRLATAMYEHHAYYEKPAHYLRISILFQKPFWRHLIPGSYFQLDAFGGCCVYDEALRYDAGPYGVLSWLLGGNDALIMSNYTNTRLIDEALASLPKALAAGRPLFLEGHVDRWIGTVSAQPGGYPIKGPKVRHVPEPKEHPGLIIIGDYLFDASINGVLDSADIATDLMLKYLRPPTSHLTLTSSMTSITARNHRAGGGLKKSYFDYYDGKQSYKKAFKQYFDAKYVTDLIHLVWGVSPPYRLLDAGSANGLTLRALAKGGVDTWGIENNHYIHRKTPRKLRERNLLGDVRNIPFEDDYFDFVYETCLCYVPDNEVDQAIRELFRITRYGVLFGSITIDMRGQAVEENELFYGIKTLDTLRAWSERFLRNDFQLAVTGQYVLKKVWKVEKKANEGDPWYPTRESMRYCFYTKHTATRQDYAMPTHARLTWPASVNNQALEQQCKVAQ